MTAIASRNRSARSDHQLQPSPSVYFPVSTPPLTLVILTPMQIWLQGLRLGRPALAPNAELQDHAEPLLACYKRKKGAVSLPSIMASLSPPILSLKSLFLSLLFLPRRSASTQAVRLPASISPVDPKSLKHGYRALPFAPLPIPTSSLPIVCSTALSSLKLIRRRSPGA